MYLTSFVFTGSGARLLTGNVQPARPVEVAPIGVWHAVEIVMGVHVHRQRELLVIVDTIGAVRLFFGGCESSRIIAARMAMIAITTSSSIKVKAWLAHPRRTSNPSRFPGSPRLRKACVTST